MNKFVVGSWPCACPLNRKKTNGRMKFEEFGREERDFFLDNVLKFKEVLE